MGNCVFIIYVKGEMLHPQMWWCQRKNICFLVQFKLIRMKHNVTVFIMGKARKAEKSWKTLRLDGMKMIFTPSIVCLVSTRPWNTIQACVSWSSVWVKTLLNYFLSSLTLDEQWNHPSVLWGDQPREDIWRLRPDWHEEPAGLYNVLWTVEGHIHEGTWFNSLLCHESTTTLHDCSL